MSSLPAAVLWDLDGTLIDTEPYWMECELELVAEYGGEWTDDDAKSIVGFDLMVAADVLRKRGDIPLRPAEIVERLMDGVVKRMRQRMPWRPGARELLAALQLRRVPCALVTMSWKPITDVVVPQLPPGSFQAVITGENVMNGKPHPEPYRRAAEDLGVDPESCVAIEDSPTGIASAEGAGCVVVAVEHLIPIPTARHRVKLSTLQGVTPELLGEFVENTPPPEREQVAPPAGPPVPRPKATPRGERPRRGFDLAALVSGRRRLLAAAAVVLLVAAAIGVWVLTRGDDGAETHEPGPFNVHTWASPYNDSLQRSLAALGNRANLFHQVSPFWYETTGVTSIGLIDDSQIDTDLTEQFIDQAKQLGVPLVPSILDHSGKGTMAAILADPAQRQAHIDTIAAFAASNDFDGIDVDYENFAFTDGEDTWAATQPNWVAFIEQLGARLHADGRILTVSVPPEFEETEPDDRSYWVYDYGGIAPHVDAIRIMAYDRHTTDTAPGSVAPRDWVDRIVDGAIDAAGGPEKLVLGIPMYGYNWVTSTAGECPGDAEGDISQSLARIRELPAERSVSAITTDEGTGDSMFTYDLVLDDETTSCTQRREVHFLDTAEIKSRMQLSIDRGLLGVALYAFGYEDQSVLDSAAEINSTLESTAPQTAAPERTLSTEEPPATAAATTSTSATTTTTP